MDLQSYTLKPFPGEENRLDLKILGTIGRRGNTLSLGLALLGDHSELAIPSPEDSPGRRYRLWEKTCLELFIAEKGSARYWEFNLSPAGNWNVYRFTSSRKGMREEPAFGSLPFRVLTEPGAIRLSLDLWMGKIIPAGKTIEVAVCAVIRTVTGMTSHWAFVHPGPLPDFHRRDGFTLILPAA
ncbi:MAG: DOMON-like domain-containing protein [Candidatus Deferrimicrobiaceae bacterium]